MSPQNAKPNAVAYAEQVLEVHHPWTDAQDALEKHKRASDECDRLRRAKAGTKQMIEDRKLEIISDAPSMNGWPADGVQKQRDFIKKVTGEDTKLADLESTLDQQTGDLDSADSARKHQELRLYAVTARMNELGGLLSFYAAAKAAEQDLSHVE